MRLCFGKCCLCFVAIVLFALADIRSASATPPAGIKPAMRLQILESPSGRTVSGLFGLFPPVTGSVTCDPNLISFQTIAIGRQEIPPLVIGNCGSTQCPAGAYPGGSGTCATNSHAQPLGQCSYDQSCINWGCSYSSGNSCCGICVWTGGGGGCGGCYTADSGCKK